MFSTAQVSPSVTLAHLQIRKLPGYLAQGGLHEHADVVETDGSVDVQADVALVGEFFEVGRAFTLIFE